MADYVCPRCPDQAHQIGRRPVTQIEVTGMLLGLEASSTFYVLVEAVNLPLSPDVVLPRELLPILTPHGSQENVQRLCPLCFTTW